MKVRLHKLLFYILLFGVYGIFFSVESFYNFEGHSDARDIFRYASLISDGHQRDATVVRTTPLHSPSTHAIRLNKRFHQSAFSLCPVLTPALPEYVPTPLVLGVYSCTHLPQPALLHRPLRGPPELA